MVSEALTALDPKMFENRTAVAIGGSAGAVQVLRRILPALNIELPIVVVVHVPSDRPSTLASLFARECTMQVEEPLDKQPLCDRVIYFAPSDYHLLIEADRTFALSIGPKVHHCRPSIDVMFASASEVFRGGLVAVIVSGSNQDGAAGAMRVRRNGGLVMVQDPATAESAEMPLEAIQAAQPQLVGSPSDLGRALCSISKERA